MMKCSVELTNYAIDDLFNLPENIQDECIEKLEELECNIHLGKPLENKFNMDLTGYYKIYLHNAEYRIVYKKIDNEIKIEGIRPNIAKVYGIGPRNNLEIYKNINKRKK